MRQDRASEDDIPAIVPLDGAALADEAAEIHRLAGGDDRDDAAAHGARVARACAEGRLLVLAARRAGRIVAAIELRLPEATIAGHGHRAGIGPIAIAPGEARRGMLLALLAAAEDEAARRGATLLTAELRAGDADAPHLRARGFRLSGRLPRGMPGGMQDAVLFWKDLEAGAAPPPPAPPPREGVEVLAHDRLFRSYLALDRFELRHRLHAGGTSAVIGRDLLVRGPAAAILLYDPDRGKVALVEQFRIGALAAGMEPWVLETVAGVVDPGEDAADVAIREALEEAGARVSDIVHVAGYLSSPGCSDETVHAFVGRVDASTLGGVHGLADEGEDIRVVVMDADDAIAACADGRIANAITLVALQWLALNRAALAARWRRA